MPEVQIGESHIEPIARFTVQTSAKADDGRLVVAVGSVIKRNQQEA